MEGFLTIRLRRWLRRLITHGIAIVPAAIVAVLYGDSGTVHLLILSPVILSLERSFAVFPLVRFTSDRLRIRTLVNPRWMTIVAYFSATIIAVLNGWLRFQTFEEWIS